MTSHSIELEVLVRIQSALNRAASVLTRFTPGAVEVEFKAGHDPVTEADRALDEALRASLVRDGEGWLSEETADDLVQHEDGQKADERENDGGDTVTIEESRGRHRRCLRLLWNFGLVGHRVILC